MKSLFSIVATFILFTSMSSCASFRKGNADGGSCHQAKSSEGCGCHKAGEKCDCGANCTCGKK